MQFGNMFDESVNLAIAGVIHMEGNLTQAMAQEMRQLFDLAMSNYEEGLETE